MFQYYKRSQPFIHVNGQMGCVRCSRMLDEASKERQWGGGKDLGGRGEVKKPWNVLTYPCKQQGCCNRGTDAAHGSWSRNRTHLICNYNMASVDASSHHYLIIARLGPIQLLPLIVGSQPPVLVCAIIICSQEIHLSLWSLSHHWISKLSLLYISFYTKCSYQNTHILKPYFRLWDS